MLVYFNITSIEIKPLDNSYRSRSIMGDNNLTIYYQTPTFVEIPIGATTDFDGEVYTVRSPQSFKKNHNRSFEYTIIFEGAQSLLSQYKFVEPNGTRLKFSVTAKAQEILTMIVANLNSRDSGWSVGTYITTVEKTLSFNHNYCSEVLQQLADAYETEWEVIGKTINLGKVEYNKSTPLALSYGKGNGFKPGVGRMNYDNSKAVELLFVQGGERNIDVSKYLSRTLLLPKNQLLTYNSKQYTTDAAGTYIKRNDKALSTHQEDSIDLSQFYPSKLGTVSSVDIVDAAKNFYDFYDTSIPDALNYETCLTAGEKMTVIFQTGMLVGREMEVKYTHVNPIGGLAFRRFELVPQEIDGVTMPNAAYKPVIGDTYKVFGIQLPDAYVCDNVSKTGASWDMFTEAVKWLDQNEDPRFTFMGDLDGIWAKTHTAAIAGKIKLGGYISFTDTQFQLTAVLIRITRIKDYINNPAAPEIELSNVTTSVSVSDTIKKIDTNEQKVEFLSKAQQTFTKRRFRDAQETMTMLDNAFDNFTAGTSPIWVKTMSMLVGDEGLQYTFSGLNPTYDAVTQKISAYTGRITHMTLGIKNISSTHTAERKYWDMTAYLSAALGADDINKAKKYYLYARVSSDPAVHTGTYILSETVLGLTQTAGYYNLLMCAVNSEFEKSRSIVPLYGFTEVLPGRITTDKIVSADGLNFMDFVNNAFSIGNATNSLDWNKNADGKLRLKGTLVQSASGIESPLSCYRGAYNATYVYYVGDEITYNGSSFICTAQTTAGINPSNATYWSVTAAKGVDAAFYENRYYKNTTPDSPPVAPTGYTPTGWTTTVPTLAAGEFLWISTAYKQPPVTLIIGWSNPMRSVNGYVIQPSLINRGEYNAVTTYYGNTARLDVVKDGTNYFVARIDAGTFSGQPTTNGTYWNAFGAQFDSVATGLLLTTSAYIENLVVKFLETDITGQRVQINPDGTMYFYDSANVLKMKLEDGILTAVGAILNNAQFNSAALSGRSVSIDDGKLYVQDNAGDTKVELWGNGVIIHNGELVVNGDTAVTFDYATRFTVLNAIRMPTRKTWMEEMGLECDSLFVNQYGVLCFKDYNGSSHRLY